MKREMRKGEKPRPPRETGVNQKRDSTICRQKISSGMGKKNAEKEVTRTRCINCTHEIDMARNVNTSRHAGEF